MKKLNNLDESSFLKLFFAFISFAFLLVSFFLPGDLISGFGKILTSTCKVTTNYFALGGYSATFLNMGLVGLICTALCFLPGAKANNVTTLAVILTIGFGSWGINPLNILPTFAGVLLYCLVKKEKPGAMINAMMFSTGIAPLISDLLLRWPNAEAVGFSFSGILIALFVGLIIGFFLPAGLAHSPAVHKGYDHYSAALPIGMTAFFLRAVLYKVLGGTLPAAPGAETLEVASWPIVNIFCIVLFGICVAVAWFMGCRPADYLKVLKDPGKGVSFSSAYGNAPFLMNVGVFGLFIVLYYNLIGASFNGVTFGIIFCMLCTCNSGSHPGNVWPIMLGYLVTSLLCEWLFVGETFALTINAQAIVIGLCYANGLSPISGKYGWAYGALAGGLHYLLVTSVPDMHGGFCLYNGGFTAALICLMFVPQLEKFCKTKEERKATK
ncbi:MAG: DUF1576 domain-containing protein [Oscillospiraceae bacterium]|nr:DUF1576 domain-containing protein [Oscillospiraceae bacterium]